MFRRTVFWTAGLTLVLTLSILGAHKTPAYAAFTPNYNENYLIDNRMFLNTQAMTQGSIQAFLGSINSGLANFNAVEQCDASIAALYPACGHPVPAAEIIMDAASAYGINPQVILATLQKEQGLVTNPNPTQSQLDFAMGYGCNDSTGCGNYSGFFSQVDNGAWVLRFNYERAGGNNTWWNPNLSYPCKNASRYYSPGLFIGNYETFFDEDSRAYKAFVLNNAATATMYCYTPHVYPGDAQHYYSGSYWFVYYYDLWFGSTYTPSYKWQPVTQYAYTDSSKMTPVDPSKLIAGQRIFVGFTAKNLGNTTWTNTGANPVRVGTSGPNDRMSAFCDPTWLACNRPASMKEAAIAPGETGTFEFWYKVPNTPSTSFQQFNLVVEGVDWMNDPQMSYYTIVNPAVYSWQTTSQYAFTDNTKTTPVDPAHLIGNQRIFVGFTAKNTGNVTWSNTGVNPISVGTWGAKDHSSAFCDPSWLACNRATRMIESSVPPGGTATFEFWYKAPPRAFSGYEQFNLVVEGIDWMRETGMSYYTVVTAPSYTWSMQSEYAYTNASKTTPLDTTQLHKGDRVYVGFTARNTGNQTWSNTGANPITAGTWGPKDHSSAFCDPSWLACNRPVRMTEASVAPGAIGTFEFWYKAPSSNFTGYEQFNLVIEGYDWMKDVGMSYYTIVN